MKINYDLDVIDYIKELIDILYDKEYFGFKDEAKEYIDKMTAVIESSIHLKPKKISPARFKRYGEYYIIYKSNKRTTWYIFFDEENDEYVIGYITNNHVSAQHIRGL